MAIVLFLYIVQIIVLDKYLNIMSILFLLEDTNVKQDKISVTLKDALQPFF